MSLFSDIDSLTELSSDCDEEYNSKSGKTKSKQKKEKKTWKLRQVLKAPRQSTHSVESIYADVTSGKCDLNPDYQREVVWGDAKQSGLIDSLLNNYYVPPVIFACHEIEDGEERRVCIDGKQRITSMQRFIDGMIPFKDPHSNTKFYYKLLPGVKGELLPERYRDQFSRKQIICVEYSDVTEENEREIFQRVQLGVALTPAERMQAIPGPWPDLVRSTLRTLDENEIGKQIEWTDTRGRDFLNVATAIYALHKPEKPFPGSGPLQKFLQSQLEQLPSVDFKSRVRDVFEVFCALLDPKWRSIFTTPKKTSPIEFCVIAEAISRYMESQSLDQLAKGIEAMRQDVRDKHDDIRSNTKVSKTLRTFVADKWPGRKGKKSSDSALAVIKAKRVDGDVPRKRKRDAEEDTKEKPKKPASTKTKIKEEDASPRKKVLQSPNLPVTSGSKASVSASPKLPPPSSAPPASAAQSATESSGFNRISKIHAAVARDRSMNNAPDRSSSSLPSHSVTQQPNGVPAQTQPTRTLAFPNVDPQVIQSILNRSGPNSPIVLPPHPFAIPLSMASQPTAFQIPGSVSDPQVMQHLSQQQPGGFMNGSANGYGTGTISAPPSVPASSGMETTDPRRPPSSLGRPSQSYAPNGTSANAAPASGLNLPIPPTHSGGASQGGDRRASGDYRSTGSSRGYGRDLDRDRDHDKKERDSGWGNRGRR